MLSLCPGSLTVSAQYTSRILKEKPTFFSCWLQGRVGATGKRLFSLCGFGGQFIHQSKIKSLVSYSGFLLLPWNTSTKKQQLGEERFIQLTLLHDNSSKKIMKEAQLWQEHEGGPWCWRHWGLLVTNLLPMDSSDCFLIEMAPLTMDWVLSHQWLNEKSL